MDFIGKCSCIHCKEVKLARGIFCHVDRTHLGKKQYSSGYNGKYDKISYDALIKKQNKETEYNKTPNYCKECNCILSFSKRNNKFCSRHCSVTYTNRERHRNGWTHSKESRNKIKESIKLFNIKQGKQVRPKTPFVIECKNCKNKFESFRISKQFCCAKCSIIQRNTIRREQRSALKNYRSDCSFKFNLKDFPEEFDFSLIEEFGWYKAKNRGNNLRGVSRDHMISVKYGFENNIDPEIISHPANCKLMRHDENSSKHTKCSITLDELLSRINIWNKKYNNI